MQVRKDLQAFLVAILTYAMLEDEAEVNATPISQLGRCS